MVRQMSICTSWDLLYGSNTSTCWEARWTLHNHCGAATSRLRQATELKSVIDLHHPEVMARLITVLSQNAGQGQVDLHRNERTLVIGEAKGGWWWGVDCFRVGVKKVACHANHMQKRLQNQQGPREASNPIQGCCPGDAPTDRFFQRPRGYLQVSLLNETKISYKPQFYHQIH